MLCLDTSIVRVVVVTVTVSLKRRGCDGCGVVVEVW